MILLLSDPALLRAVFPDWRIFAESQAWHATLSRATPQSGSGRLAAVGRQELTASTPADLAIQLAALEYPPGITPMT